MAHKVFGYDSTGNELYVFRAPDEKAAEAHCKKRYGAKMDGRISEVGTSDAPKKWGGDGIARERGKDDRAVSRSSITG